MMHEATMTLKQRKQYRKTLLAQDEAIEIDERQELRRRVKYASLGVQHYAMLLHMRKWRQYYTMSEVDQQERICATWGFAPYDFELWASGD